MPRCVIEENNQCQRFGENTWEHTVLVKKTKMSFYSNCAAACPEYLDSITIQVVDSCCCHVTIVCDNFTLQCNIQMFFVNILSLAGGDQTVQASFHLHADRHADKKRKRESK